MNLKEFVKRMIEKYDLEDLYLYESRGRLVLSNIRVKKDSRKQGIGTAFMEELIRFADNHDIDITLTPATNEFDGTTSASRLKKFYKRFGFVENKGRNKDYRISDSMIRRSKALKENNKMTFKQLREKVQRGYKTDYITTTGTKLGAKAVYEHMIYSKDGLRGLEHDGLLYFWPAMDIIHDGFYEIEIKNNIKWSYDHPTYFDMDRIRIVTDEGSQISNNLRRKYKRFFDELRRKILEEKGIDIFNDDEYR